MGAFTPAIPFLLAGLGGGLQASAIIGRGRAAEASGKARQAELDREGKLATIAAKESQAIHLGELGRTIGTMRALRGSRNLGADSPSGQALEAELRRVGLQNVQRERFSARQQASSLWLAGKAARTAGRNELLSSYLGAAGSFVNAATSVVGKK